MDFELSEEHKMLRDMTAKFAQTEFPPYVHVCDVEEKYTPELRLKAAENGLIGAWIPEEYGGAGVGIMGNTLITEEYCKVDMGLCMSLLSSFGCEIIYQNGTEAQKKELLPPVCAGKKISAGAFTEPNAGTDVAGYGTRAVKDKDDYVINGNKMFITNGTVCSFMLTACITNPEEKRHKRYSIIQVPADTEGITRTKIHGKMGIRTTDTAEIAFEDVRVPRSNLIGEVEGRGFYQLMHFFDTTRIQVAAQALGLAEACLAESIRYVKERTAFGAPLGSCQLTQKKLAEMAIRIEALRGMTYKASWLMDQGRPDYTLSAMAKFFGGETAVFCANYAVELHGGYGYINEYAVEKLYRDAKALELFEGTKEAEIMTIGRALQG